MKVLRITSKSVGTLILPNDGKAFKTALGGIRSFTAISRQIGRKKFTIYLDDEGLLQDEIPVSGMNIDYEEFLVGNLLIANEYEATDLTDDDISYIKNFIVKVQSNLTVEYCGRTLEIMKGDNLLIYGNK